MQTETAIGLCSLLAAAAGTLAPVTPALADDGCSIYRINVPDLDQKRSPLGNIEGLPNNGSMYCVPTSTSNWLAYMKLIGASNLFMGGPDWTNFVGYDNATFSIDLMGDWMSTSATGGTGNQGWLNGMAVWFFTEDEPIVTWQSWDLPETGITPYLMYQKMKQGDLVLLCYGRYTVAPASGNLPQRFVRGGGHCITLNTVTNACSQISNIGYRDPASGGDSTTTQSGFATRYINVTPVANFFAGNSTDQPAYRTYTQMAGTPGDTTYRFLDKLRVISSIDGWSVNAIDGVFSIKKYYDFNRGLANPPHTTHALPAVPGRQIVGMKRHPFLHNAAVIVDGLPGGDHLPGIYSVSASGEDPVRLGDSPQGGVMCFGPDSDLYVGRPGQIEGLSILNPARPPVVCGVGDHTVLALCAGEAGGGGDATGFNLIAVTRDPAGQLYLAEIPTHPGGCGPFNPQPLPRDLQFSGGCEVAQTREHILLARQVGVPAMYKVDHAAGGGGWILAETIPVPEGVPARNLQIDDHGRIVYTANGIVRVLKPGAAGGWVPATSSPWHGYQAGDFFSMNRSMNSTLPWPEGPGDVQNLDPDSENREIGGVAVVDCPADFNQDGFVDFFDFDGFVTCFEGGECLPDNPADFTRDFNQDGFVDFFDFDAFVQAFERGC